MNRPLFLAFVAFALTVSPSVASAADTTFRLLSPGRRVRTLIPGTIQSRGPHSVAWDGADDQGRPVPAGVLFVRLQTSHGSTRTTLVRVR